MGRTSYMIPPVMALAALRVRISGVVQGVGFRYFAWSIGRNLELCGWVRNERDGSVLCEVKGPPAAVEQFVVQVRSGPAHARVEACTLQELAPDEVDDQPFAVAR